MYIQDTFEQLSSDSFEQLPAYYLNGLNLESRGWTECLPRLGSG